jgi:hypothetical protein
LPSQTQNDSQPLPTPLGDKDKYEVEEILAEKAVGRGQRQRKKFLVKWIGYARPTWEPEDTLATTTALEKWEMKMAQGRQNANPAESQRTRRSQRRRRRGVI